jgi:hypothetical protein
MVASWLSVADSSAAAAAAKTSMPVCMCVAHRQHQQQYVLMLQHSDNVLSHTSLIAGLPCPTAPTAWREAARVRLAVEGTACGWPASRLCAL